MPLIDLLPREEILSRLLEIFPEGSPFRNYCTRDMAGATVFTLLYVDAIEGTGRCIGPKHVYKMSDEQAALTSESERLAYGRECSKSRFTARGTQWYADNTREPIRDETIRQGLIPVGAVTERKDLPTTSPAPRYALSKEFAELFDPNLKGNALSTAITKWQEKALSPAGLARIRVVKAGRAKDKGRVSLTLPNGDTRQMKPGKSSVITKQVVEAFAPRFLESPAVVWISESGKKVVESDDDLAKSIGIVIDATRTLPDVILADVARDKILLVFVEVVATDGPISEARRTELLEIASAAGISESRTAFVTAYLERNSSVLKKNLPDLAWNSFIWLASEPDHIVALHAGDETGPRLESLLQFARHLRAVK